MSKLLLLGAAMTIVLMLNGLWLHAALFVFGYAALIELWRHAKRLRRDLEYIDMMRKSMNGLRRSQRGKL